MTPAIRSLPLIAILLLPASVCSSAAAQPPVRVLDPVLPAEVVQLSLAELGLPASADRVRVSGAVSEVLVKDGTLRFSTPGDTGAAQQASVRLEKDGVATILSVPITTARPAAVQAYDDANEDGAARPAPPRLALSGLGPHNSLGGQPLTFTLAGVPPLALAKDSSGMIRDARNRGVERLQDYWTFHPRENRFSIEGARLRRLMTALPAGAVTLTLNFVSADGEFAAAYDLLAIARGATVAGSLITPAGAAATELAGRKMLLRGVAHGVRRVVPVDGQGGFSFAHVVPDTYELELSDLDKPRLVTSSFALWPGTTNARVTMVYPQGAQGGGPAAGGPSVAASVTQDGSAPQGRR